MNDISLYQEIAPLVGTGDLVEFCSNDPIGEAIRLRTHYDVNHTGLVILMQSPYRIGVYTRRYLHQALADGIDIDYLSVVLQKYDGQAWWYPLKDELKPDIPDIEERAFSYVGVPYDYEGLFRQLLGHTQIGAHKLFCSEYAQITVTGQLQGIAFWPGELPQRVPAWKERVRVL